MIPELSSADKSLSGSVRDAKTESESRECEWEKALNEMGVNLLDDLEYYEGKQIETRVRIAGYYSLHPEWMECELNVAFYSNNEAELFPSCSRHGYGKEEKCWSADITEVTGTWSEIFNKAAEIIKSRTEIPEPPK